MPSRKKRRQPAAKNSGPSAKPKAKSPAQPQDSQFAKAVQSQAYSFETTPWEEAKKFPVPAVLLVLLVAALFVAYPYLSNQAGSLSSQQPGAQGKQPSAGAQPGILPLPGQGNNNSTIASASAPGNPQTNSSPGSNSSGSGSGNAISSPSASGFTGNSGSGGSGSSPNQAGSGQAAPGTGQSSGQNNSENGSIEQGGSGPVDASGSPYASYFGITIGTVANTTVGSQFSLPLTAAGGTGNYQWSVSGLPPGLSLSSSSIYGVPSQSGIFSVQITVTDGVSSSTQYLRITVD